MVTRYASIVETLRSEIESGRYVLSFPSEAQLVKRFSVSRQTVVRAVGELVKFGLVERRRGSGTFVSRKVRRTLGTVGLVLPCFAAAPFVNALSGACRSEGYTLLFRNISEPYRFSYSERMAEARRLAQGFAEAKVSGVLMQPLQHFAEATETSRELLRIFRQRRIPVVLIDHDVGTPTERSGCDVIGVDNFRIGYAIGSHLAACGAKRIAFLMHANWAPTVTERMYGVAAAVLDAGLDWRADRNVIDCMPADVKGISRALRAYRADAIACGNDVEAAYLLRTLRSLRLAVPRRILVTGVDDMDYAAMLTPSLTTVRQPIDDLAQVAANRLFWRMRHPTDPPVSIRLPTELVVRESTTR